MLFVGIYLMVFALVLQVATLHDSLAQSEAVRPAEPEALFDGLGEEFLAACARLETSLG